ncbi:MAG: glutaredoxin 3 [Pseudomonadota bacterium]
MSDARPEILVYTTPVCPYCVQAKMLLRRKGAAFREIDVARDPALRQEVMARSGRRTVPQIWIGEYHVGGFDELYALEREGRLDGLIAGTAA